MARKFRLTSAHVSDFLSTHLKEAVKQHIEYDGFHRMIAVYVANIDAANGDYCMLTRYVYDGNSTRVVYMAESLANWDSTWEM
jgi:hypothetical protein